MKSKSTPYLILLLLGLLMLGACSDNLMDELPRPIASFVNTYFPGNSVKDYTFSNDTYMVKLSDGATATFNINLAWTEVDGNGSTLPAGFINDQLPPGLLEYLQSMTPDENIYAVSRDDSTFTVTLKETTLSYNITDGNIVYPDGRTYPSN